ncbi:hypothetical protein A2U01_0000580 [Trifolium medium]|uniref:Uncharacterized protein n=1 Tax=Trifolium medium TaxID=97028 RepID=A0A392LXY0_9FABA|nr:hypothetical protein [Trifolium medium]
MSTMKRGYMRELLLNGDISQFCQGEALHQLQLNVLLLSEPSKDLGFAMWVRSLTQMLLSMHVYV